MTLSFDRWLARTRTQTLLKTLTGIGNTCARVSYVRQVRPLRTRQQSTCALPLTQDTQSPSIADKGAEGSNQPPRSRCEEDATRIDFVGLTTRGDLHDNAQAQAQAPDDEEYAYRELREIMQRPDQKDQFVKDNDRALLPWLEVLQRKWHEEDLHSIYKIWQLMQEQTALCASNGPTTNAIWSIFTAAAVRTLFQLKDDHFLLAILRNARTLMREQDTRYVHLHRDVVGRILFNFGLSHNTAERLGRRWQKRMANFGLTRPEDLLALLEDAMRNSTPDIAFQRFKLIYFQQRSDELDQQCVSLIKQYGHLRGARNWISFFQKSHVPDTSDNDKSEAVSAPVNLQLETARSETFQFTRQTMNSLLGEVHGITEKHYSDQFCAKVLATRFFSLQTCLKVLQVLGVQQLGSLAILELARRMDSPSEIFEHLNHLREIGVQVPDSSLLRLVKHCASSNDTALLSHLLASDQHPDEFANTKLQKRLLMIAVDEKDWLSMELSLMALTVAGQRMDTNYWNVLMRHHINEADFRSCRRVFAALRLRQISLSAQTVDSMFRNILPTRVAGHGPATRTRVTGASPSEVMDFAILASTYSAECGERVHPRLFSELLKRCGMTGQTAALERLLMWIGRFFSATRIAASPYLGAYSIRVAGKRPFDAIMQSNMQKAIVMWEWNAAVLQQASWQPTFEPLTNNSTTIHDPLTSCPWFRGVQVLRHLRDEGHPIGKRIVREAVLDQLWKLFGPGFSIRRINKVMQSRNNISLYQYIADANSVWPDLLPELRSDGHIEDSLQAFFGKRRCRRSRPIMPLTSSMRARHHNQVESHLRTYEPRGYQLA